MLRHTPLALALALALTALACGESDDPGTPAGSTGGTAGAGSGGSGAGGAAGAGSVPGGAIRGSVSYSGAETGALVVGVYTACPPAGPPVNLNMKRFDTPAFPQSYELTSVDPGSYYVVGVLDVGSNDPTMPGPEDKQACSDRVTVTAAEGATADVAIAP